MGPQDLVDVFLVRDRIPDAFGIDDDGRPELTAVEATGIVDADFLQSQLPCPVLHIVAQLLAALVGAAATRVAGRPPVGAAEDVGFVVGLRIGRLLARTHNDIIPSCPRRCWRAASRTPAGSAASARPPASRLAARS